MLTNQALEAQLLQDPDITFVKVSGDGYHYELQIVSDAFEGRNRVARQQWVYSRLKAYITSGSLHAISMQTWTTKEWGDHRG